MSNWSDHTPTNPAIPAVLCPACSSSTPAAANFCPNCGERLKTMPLSTSVLKQAVIYLVSFFLAPLGLWYAWKYLRQQDTKSKIIGAVSVGLTIVSLAISLWAMREALNTARQLLNSLGGLGL